MHIHIVDDDPVIRTLIMEYVRFLGHHATISENGKDALTLLGSSTPDLLLLDFQLPDITGAEVIDKLHKQHGTLPYPVVLLSASESSDILAKKLAFAPFAFLHKPFDMAALSDLITDVESAIEENPAD